MPPARHTNTEQSHQFTLIHAARQRQDCEPETDWEGDTCPQRPLGCPGLPHCLPPSPFCLRPEGAPRGIPFADLLRKAALSPPPQSQARVLQAEKQMVCAGGAPLCQGLCPPQMVCAGGTAPCQGLCPLSPGTAHSLPSPG